MRTPIRRASRRTHTSRWTGSGTRSRWSWLREDPRQDPDAPAKTAHRDKVHLFGHKFGVPTRVGSHGGEAPELYLRAQRPFPPGTSVTLVWGAGIATPSGAATVQDQKLAFKSRPEFEANFNCERENAEAACLPISPMSLNFNADVPWSFAKKIRIRALQGGQEWKPAVRKEDHTQDGDGVTYVTFKGPLPEKTQYELVLPAGLTDDSGRALINASRFPLKIATADFPPLLKFPADFGVLELKPEAVLPVTVRNVEAQLQANLGALARTGGGETIDGKAARVGASQFGRVVKWLARLTQISARSRCSTSQASSKSRR